MWDSKQGVPAGAIRKETQLISNAGAVGTTAAGQWGGGGSCLQAAHSWGGGSRRCIR